MAIKGKKESVGDKEHFAEFKKLYPKEAEYFKNIRSFSQALSALNEEMWMYMLESGEPMRLPRGLGHITVYKFKIPTYKMRNGVKQLNLPIDWQKTRQLWDSDPVAKENKKVVYHFNHHSDGYSYRWGWRKKKAFLHNKEIWNMDMYRVPSRTLVKKIKDPERGTFYQSLYTNTTNLNQLL